MILQVLHLQGKRTSFINKQPFNKPGTDPFQTKNWTEEIRWREAIR